ncbi:MAG: glucose 1-dehydrogenase [Ktedonobacteraceae bacterium]
MKAVAVYPASREIKLIEQAEPEIKADSEVKLKILDVGICGTDRHICTFAFGTPPPGSDHLIIGHEALGEVVEVGSGVQHLRAGDLVVPVVRRPCTDPGCRACRAGRQDFCFTGTYTERGIVGLNGYMTEIVVDDVRYLNPVPPELRSVAILTEPLTIAEKAFAQVWQIQQRLPWLYADASPDEPGRGLKAVVLGAGPIGLLGAMFLVAAGFETYVYSRSPAPNSKAAVVEEIGARYISSETTPLKEFADMVGTFELVYEALDAAPLSIEVMQLLGRNGIFVFTSVPDERITFGIDTARALDNLTMKNQVIVGTVNAGPATFPAAIAHLGTFQKRWPHALQALITARYPVEQYADLLLSKAGGIKNVVSFETVAI